MKKVLLTLFYLPCLLCAQSQRQTYYWTPSAGCSVQSFTPRTGGGNLLSGYSKYGSDSCHINLIFLNDSDVTVSHKEFNTATIFDFASHVIPFNNGFLIGGKSSDPSFFHPELIMTDANGNVQWAKYFDNTSYWQGQVIRIIPHGNTYSMYTFAETPVGDFYRIEGDAAGSTFTGSQYTPDTAMSFRVFDAEQMNNSSSHILCGHADFNSATTRGGLLMKTTAAGVQWCKHISANGNAKNDIVDVAAGTDGNSYSVFVCENMPGNQYSTIVLKFDSLGNKVWAKQLSISSGTVNGCSIIESASHDFYVASYDNLFVAYLSKIDAAGNLAWTHKWTPSSTGGASGLKLFKDVNNNIVFTGLLANSYFVARLDANGGGCGFTNSTVISATNATTVITNISFTTTAFAPTTTSENTVYTSQGYTESMICGGVGIEEVEQNNSLMIYPNPVKNKFTIHSRLLSGSQFTNETAVKISVYNVTGELILVPPFIFEVGEEYKADVSQLHPGIYLVEVSDGQKVYREKFIKE